SYSKENFGQEKVCPYGCVFTNESRLVLPCAGSRNCSNEAGFRRNCGSGNTTKSPAKHAAARSCGNRAPFARPRREPHENRSPQETHLTAYEGPQLGGFSHLTIRSDLSVRAFLPRSAHPPRTPSNNLGRPRGSPTH